MLKLQVAMEYLLTYSWALLIAGAVIAALFLFGILSPGTTAGTGCVMPAGISCPSIFLLANGLATINILQATVYSLNITALGCNIAITTANMMIPNNPPTNQINLQPGANYTFSNLQCYSNGAPFSAPAGTEFTGYLIVNYTNLQTGLPQTVSGKLFARTT